MIEVDDSRPLAPSRVDTLQVSPGVVLRTGVWAAPPGSAAGTVLLLGGQAEFLEKYARVAGVLHGWGFAVCSFDWRGQGGSTRLLAHSRRGHVMDFAAYLEDLEAVRHGPLARLPGPLYVLAHSMGGHLALRWLAQHAPPVHAGVLTAPMLGIYTHPWPGWAACAGAQLARRVGLGRQPVPGGGNLERRRREFAGNPYTADADMHLWVRSQQAQHPELCVQGVTLGWLAAACDSLRWLRSPGVAQRITTPLTLLLAGEERVVDTPATRAFSAGLPDARIVEIPGARHELLMERPAVRAQVWAEVARRFGVPAAQCAAAGMTNP